MRMVSATGWGFGGLACRARRSLKLDILRLTTRGLQRSRRGGRRAAAISLSRRSTKGGQLRAGQAALEAADGAAQDAEGTGEAQAIRVEVGAGRSLGHREADGQMRQRQAVDLLDDLARAAAADVQGRAAVGLVDLDLVGGGFDLPALVVLGRQRRGRGLLWVQQRGDQAVALLAPRS